MSKMRDTIAKKLDLKKVGYGVAGLLLLVTVYLLGVTKGYYEQVTASNFGKVFHNEFRKQEFAGTDFSLYWQVLDLARQKYFGTFDPRDVLYGSIKGAVAGLGDRYTIFTDPKENQEFFDALDGIYEGIGVEIDIIDNELIVIAPLKNSPAEAAGLQPKDRIVAIDGASVEGLGLSEILSKIKGPSGSLVTLTIVRNNESPLEIKVERKIIKTESLSFEVNNDVAVIKIYRFASDTQKLFNTAIDEIQAKKIDKIVLDLRNNPGGFLDAGVFVANEFIKSGTIVEERFKDGQTSPFASSGNGRLTTQKVVVLINQGSASAAEIVAGALQDNSRAQIMGEASFGKGSVQEVESFEDGSALRVTVAQWFTPAGRSISDLGIKPDVEVVSEPGAVGDTVLTEAIKLLNK